MLLVMELMLKIFADTSGKEIGKVKATTLTELTSILTLPNFEKGE